MKNWILTIRQYAEKESEISLMRRFLAFVLRGLHIVFFTARGRSCIAGRRAFRLIKDRKKTEEGYFWAEKAVALDSGNVLAHYLCACCLIYKDSFNEALVHIDTALEILNKPRSLFCCLPQVPKEELERYKELIIAHITLLNNPQDAENYMRLADFYYLEKEYRKTLIVLQEVEKYDPESPVIQEFLGRVFC